MVQAERLGTAHAALAAAALFGSGEVAVLYADNPLIRPDTLRALLARRAAGDAALALLAMRPPEPGRYGRVIGADGTVERIVEWDDATAAERVETLCNAGVLCAAAPDMARWLRAVRADNAKREYYLTDLVALARGECALVAAVLAPYGELRGINSRAELAEAEAMVQSLAARSGAGGRRDDDRPRLGLPRRRHGAGKRRDDRAERGVRPRRGGGGRCRDPRVQPSGGVQRRTGLHRRPVRAAAPRHGAGGRRACRQLRRAEGRIASAPGPRRTT